MYTYMSRILTPRALLALAVAIAIAGFSAANAAVITYSVNLNGANEAPPNASPGVGTGIVEVDPVAHTMRVTFNFSGLNGPTSACHIHAATAVPGAGTAGVATTTPTFAWFPLGVNAGAYDNTLNMTLTSSYNPAYVTAHGGTTAQAEADLFQAIAEGRAYLNVHTSLPLGVPGGEIRAFLVPVPLPTAETTWGSIKALYR